MNKFLNLIKRGGGTGPVKPGNQHSNVRWCQFLRDIFLADEVTLVVMPLLRMCMNRLFNAKKSTLCTMCHIGIYK